VNSLEETASVKLSLGCGSGDLPVVPQPPLSVASLTPNYFLIRPVADFLIRPVAAVSLYLFVKSVLQLAISRLYLWEKSNMKMYLRK
jgi:hypothetical protein